MDAWRALWPWMELLRGRLRAEDAEMPHSARRSLAWLQLALPKRRRAASGQPVRELREALELLAVVAAADARALRELLQHKCGVRVEPEESVALRVILVLDDHTKESILWPAALCNKFFGLLTPVAYSDGFLEVKRAAIKQMRDMRRGRAGEEIAIPFCLHFAPKRMGSVSLGQYLNSVLKVLQDLQADEHERKKRASPEDEDQQAAADAVEEWGKQRRRDAVNMFGRVAPFCLDAIQLNLSEFELNEGTARALEGILNTGVSVSCLQLPLCATDFLSDDECPRQPLATCFQAIVGVDPAPSFSDAKDLALNGTLSPEHAVGGVETLVVHGRDIDDRRFAALCSSLSEAQSTTELVLESVFTQDSMPARIIKWKWLAFALASKKPPEVSSTVRKLTITESHLFYEDVEAMELVFESPWPQTELFDPLWSLEDQLTAEEGGSPSQRYVKLEKDTIIYMEPVLYPEDWLERTVVIQHPITVAVMANDPEREWIDVLVPGYGKCWVHEEAAVMCSKPVLRQTEQELSSNQDELASIHRSVLTSIALALNVKNDDILVRLFALIGSSLEDVCLSVTTLEDEAIGLILESCPKVKRLVLRGIRLESMEVFIQAFEKGSQISSLTLSEFEINIEELSAFVRLLSEKRTCLKSLRELCIGPIQIELVDDAAKKQYRSLLDSLLLMLESNRTTLEFLEVYIPVGFTDEYGLRFKEHDNIAMLDANEDRALLRPLSLSSRLAFLSVLKARGLGRLLQPQGEVTTKEKASGGHRALTQIFEFASSSLRRSVRVIECE